ncbi:hypothetical protein CSC35_4416 [Enterobacter hormaechei]|nr:hypothetical protein CSC35_4416 [Enterobacter hormaechei]
MVIKGSVAPRPIVNNNDDASSAAVERLIDGFIFLPDKCLCFFVVLLQDYHGIGSLYSTQFICKCFSSVPELMIFSRGYFFCYLEVFTKF